LTRVLVTIPGGQSMLDDGFSRLSRREEQDVRTARSAFNPKRMAAIIDAGRTGPCGGRDDPTRSISADGGEPSDDWSCRLTVSHYDPGSDHQCARGGDAHPGMVVTVGIGRDRRSTPSLERTSLLISLLMIHAPMGGCLIRCLNSADRLHAAHLWGALRRQRSHGLWSCPISQTGRSATSSSPPPVSGSSASSASSASPPA